MSQQNQLTVDTLAREMLSELKSDILPFWMFRAMDTENGGWLWRCDRTGEPYLGEPKVDPWKGPYHNSRACMEVYERCSRLKKP